MTPDPEKRDPTAHADLPPPQPGELGEQEFRELADNAPVMIWRSRLDKQCDWFNKPWRDYTQRSLEELAGYGWAEDVHPDDLERCVGIYESAFDAREPFSMAYRLRGADGQYRWFLDNGAPFERNGVFAGYFGSCVDITEQRELEEHQRVLMAELDHRVKNNLQLVISFLQLARLRSHSDETKATLQEAIARIQGVGVVHEQLHRSGSGTVDLADYLPSLARAVLGAEGGSRRALSADVASIAVPFKLASNLGLIVNELVTNAIKHGGDGGTLRLSLQRVDAATAELVVADDGPGFSGEMLGAHGGTGKRGTGLIEALARACRAELTRSNRDGARVGLRFPVGQRAGG